MRKRRRMTITPSKGMVAFSRVIGGIFAVIALVMLVSVVPVLFMSGFGGAGILPVVMLVAFIGLGIFIACNKRGSYFMREWSIDEEIDGGEPSAPPGGSAEERLKQLQNLREQSMVSDAEYEEKRKEILKEL